MNRYAIYTIAALIGVGIGFVLAGLLIPVPS